MKRKHIDLLNYMLDQNSIVTSKQLAAALSLSPRSVKNYVNDINSIAKHQVIISSNQGYSLYRDEAIKLLNSINSAYIPQNNDERAHYIIKKILIDHKDSLNIFDLCDELYISYSTLKRTITKMRKAFSNFHIDFICENNELNIEGTEQNKRRLASYVIYEEMDKNYLDLRIIEESFIDIETDKMSMIIRETFKEYNYYINDFSFMNLLLHLAIIVDRIREGNVVSDNKLLEVEHTQERLFIDDLCHRFEDEFQIEFNVDEKFEIYMLFKANANYSMPNSTYKLVELVGEEVVTLTNYIITDVNNHYYIDLDHESFVTPFALHLKNLLFRATNNKIVKNPMVDVIKTSYPTVYDIAISISLTIEKLYQVHICEDETAFIALHIGAEIERQKSNDTKIDCILLCPDYMQLKSQLYNYLLQNFGNQINIKQTISYENELENLKYELLLTTINLEKNHKKSNILISPFANKIDKSTISNAIDKVKRDRKNYILKKNFHDFFYPDLFFADPKYSNKYELIKALTSNLYVKGFVDKDFEDKVLLRENAASTAFGNIAIPHSLKMDADKTCVTVVISKDGIVWDNNLVNIVFLMAINKTDKRTFHELYEALIELFSDDYVMDKALQCNNFKDFENLIYSSINFISKN